MHLDHKGLNTKIKVLWITALCIMKVLLSILSKKITILELLICYLLKNKSTLKHI